MCVKTSALLVCIAYDGLHERLQAAERAAQATAGMKARAGRASYVSSEHLTNPDPGAHAVAVWMRAVYEACKSSTTAV